MAYLRVIYGKEAIGYIGNLLEGLSSSAYLKQIPIINKEVALQRMLDIMQHGKLAAKIHIYIPNYKFYEYIYIWNCK